MAHVCSFRVFSAKKISPFCPSERISAFGQQRAPLSKVERISEFDTKSYHTKGQFQNTQFDIKMQFLFSSIFVKSLSCPFPAKLSEVHLFFGVVFAGKWQRNKAFFSGKMRPRFFIQKNWFAWWFLFLPGDQFQDTFCNGVAIKFFPFFHFKNRKVFVKSWKKFNLWL